MFKNKGISRFITILNVTACFAFIPIALLFSILTVISFLTWSMPTFNPEPMRVFWAIDRIITFIGFFAGVCWACSDEWSYEHDKEVTKRLKEQVKKVSS